MRAHNSTYEAPASPPTGPYRRPDGNERTVNLSAGYGLVKQAGHFACEKPRDFARNDYVTIVNSGAERGLLN
jgi:hypothetical protein